MASISKCVIKDCKLQLNHAVYRPISCYPLRKAESHMDLRRGLCSTESQMSSLAVSQEKALSPVIVAYDPLRRTSTSRCRSSLFHCKAATNYSGDVPSSAPKEMGPYEKIVETLTTLFPVWVCFTLTNAIVLAGAENYGFFRQVTWLETDLFTIALGFLMLSMGLTLTFEDFRRCLRNPWPVGVGFLAQYFIKPMLGFFIAMTLKLSAPLATGLILVSCCPGGQASNVATYIAKGNVALSVLMTT
ncbi:hypothetical protein Cgig2_018612 [Carnegiea gigantea]|uniref:Uncharacterized protein n=1 Tax=Carnegiea gigantea TaxID=171969 RepID=A0A9Q1KGE2_9CARY|nr:hypothetical protein Cgig2_018612 [Carnegiea gigantea]